MTTPEPWIVCEGTRRTHADLRAAAARAGSGFRALGVREGNTIALLLGNGLPFVEAQLAARLAGAVPVPINRHAAPQDVAYVLHDCGARLMVAKAALLRDIDLPAGLAVLVVDPQTGSADPPWDAWLARHPPIDAPAGPSTAPVIYTSGTTGRPKGVRRAPAAPGSQPVRALAVYGFDRPGRATALIDGPLYHSVPNAYLRLALGAGAEIVLRPRHDPEAMLAAIAEHRVTHLHIVPAMMLRLLGLPEAVRARHDLSSLRHVVHGAAPCPPALKRAMIDWWGPVIHEYYGSTETGLLTLIGPDEALARPGSVGRALPGITLHVLDPEGRPVAPGKAGEVYAGSETLHRFTYIGQDDRRAAIGRGDLVTAGDLGRLDPDGYLYLLDRKRDVVAVGGTAVYPAAVEAALLAIDGVADAAAFGLPDGPGREVLCAAVSPQPGRSLDAEALRRTLEQSLRTAEVPGRIMVVAALPREQSGKLFKDRLRREFAGSVAL